MVSSVHLLPDTLKRRPSAKFQPRFFGPFRVRKCIGPVAYRLDLPASCQFHPTVHVSRLRKYTQADPSVRPEVTLPESFEIDGDEYWSVESILDHRVRGRGRNRRTEYLVKWKGYGSNENTWEPDVNLTQAAIQAYKCSAKQSNNIRSGPKARADSAIQLPFA